jgi:hypothetical protein
MEIIFDSWEGVVIMGLTPSREGGSVIYSCCGASPAQSSSGLSPAGIMAILYYHIGLPFLAGQVPVWFPQGQGGPVVLPGTGFPFYP